jgi:hypothetical protein
LPQVACHTHPHTHTKHTQTPHTHTLSQKNSHVTAQVHRRTPSHIVCDKETAMGEDTGSGCLPGPAGGACVKLPTADEPSGEAILVDVLRCSAAATWSYQSFCSPHSIVIDPNSWFHCRGSGLDHFKSGWPTPAPFEV